MEFRILGQVEVWRSGAQVPVPGTRQRRLLAALLLDLNRTVSVSRLIDMLWDAEPPVTAREQVHNTVAALRRALWLTPASSELLRESAGYRLRADPDQLDARVFQRLAAEARELPTEQAIRVYREALDLWRGPALADLSGPALLAAAAGLDEQRLGCVEEYAALCLATGTDLDIAAYLAPFAAAHPLREKLAGHRMHALYVSGRQAEALECYRDLHRLLAEEHGLDPGPELRELHAAILRSDPDLDPRPAAGPAAPAGLPTDVGDFTGRHAELADLDRLAGSGPDGTAVLITLVTGTAGVGKTALAIHWGHQRSDLFPDGQLYVDLRGYDPGPPVSALVALSRLLRALGVEPERIPEDLDAAAERYRSLLAGRRMLVVLDNAATAEHVRPLLPGSSPGCQVLVTSRDRLTGLVAREGARALPLAPLAPAEAGDLISRIIGRHRADAEPEALAALATACDRLPLALRITAANLSVLPDRLIAEHVAELTAADTIDRLAVPDDERSAVRPAFDQSYARLTDDERVMFRRLGLVPGPDFTAEVAAVLADADAGPGAGAAVLDRLTGAHLVESRGGGRLVLHDLIRRYARERSLAEDGPAGRDASVERLFEHYLRHAAAGGQALLPLLPAFPGRDGQDPPFADPESALRWLDAERPNLISAAGYAAEHGPGRFAWQLAYYLRGYFVRGAHAADGLAVSAAGLAAAEAADDPHGRAAMRFGLGLARLRASRYEEAIEHLGQAAELARLAGWDHEEASAEGHLGIAHSEAGNLREAAVHHRRAIALNERTGRPIHLATNLVGLSGVHFELCELAAAEEHMSRALAIHRSSGSPGPLALTLSNLAMLNHQLGRLDEAVANITEALELVRHHDDVLEAGMYNTLAEVHHDAGRPEMALEHAERALATILLFEHPYVEALVRRTLGMVLGGLGRHADAGRLHSEALAGARAAGLPDAEILALVGLSATARATGRADEAVGHAALAVEVARTRHFRLLEGVALGELAEARLAAGDPAAAEAAGAAFDVLGPGGHRIGAARALITLGAAAGGDAAREHWRAAAALLDGLDVPEVGRIRALVR
ncbi:SARP family transcriptional regulator [Longispora fulva]|uniref:DNA-binding SARP family transcriptional activator/Tfp pilus assembly protein PilF n=1 Tax=Longispora fulva TaxID=619741 RepID=A0A8J7KGD2_9ACTN|nr:BTAD domain-containing putative transcriptional regulator [Longispora fulva]MBG6134824.1 DNA-binding SARP family transcriptional activator/Tfp pilus assembly protein PilF [Longispora fulva]GIG56944.1 SARP family transcriptional regulator [Longispora fulva]